MLRQRRHGARRWTMSLVGYDAIADESWSRLEEAADDPTHPMRLLVLATVAPDGSPDGRVMVLRGADRRLGKIWFHTDRRSEKVQHLRSRPSLCAVAFDPREGIQLRVRGTSIIHESNALADRHWSQTGMVIRALYASADAPGSPFPQPDPRLMGVQRAICAGQEQSARDNFAVIETEVKSLEWLQVKESEQRRAIMYASTGWVVHPVAP